MQLTELLTVLTDISKTMGTTTPYVCGGAPRDKVMNRLDALNDVDLTTGDSSIHHLAKEASIKLRGPNTFFKEMPDGHSQITVDGIKIDFSSNYIFPGVDSLLIKAGMKNPTEMQQELYSRDFTCNALLMTLDFKSIKDPTGLGIKDIKAKTLRTCLPARLTLGSDNRRVVRVIYLAAKLGFTLDKEIVAWLRANPATIANANDKYISAKISQALEFNKDYTLNLLDEFGLWQYLPMTETIREHVAGDIRRI